MLLPISFQNSEDMHMFGYVPMIYHEQCGLVARWGSWWEAWHTQEKYACWEFCGEDMNKGLGNLSGDAPWSWQLCEAITTSRPEGTKREEYLGPGKKLWPWERSQAPNVAQQRRKITILTFLFSLHLISTWCLPMTNPIRSHWLHGWCSPWG